MRLIDADWLHDALTDNHSGAGVLTLDNALEMIDEADTIDPVHAAGGCYCRECKYQEDCDCWVTHSYRDRILEKTVYKHRKLEWCSYGEKEGKL